MAYSTNLRMHFVVSVMQTGGTRRADAASFDVEPPTAGKRDPAFASTVSVGPPMIDRYRRSTLEVHEEWVREHVRARTGITVR